MSLSLRALALLMGKIYGIIRDSVTSPLHGTAFLMKCGQTIFIAVAPIPFLITYGNSVLLYSCFSPYPHFWFTSPSHFPHLLYRVNFLWIIYSFLSPTSTSYFSYLYYFSLRENSAVSIKISISGKGLWNLISSIPGLMQAIVVEQLVRFALLPLSFRSLQSQPSLGKSKD